MAVRRIWISNPRMDGRPIADFEGLPEEQGETELYFPYGFATGREGGGVLIEIQDDPDNHLALPPRGDRGAFESTVVYWKDTMIELTDDRVEVTVGGKYFRLETGGIETDMDIHTTGTIRADGDVIADGKSLKTHRHSGVDTGGGTSGPPV